MRIDPQRLIRLAMVIQHGSFRRAADHLGLTQPALSQSIAQIEKEVGAKLIERTPHGMEPTLYGQLLYEHAKAIDRELVQAAQRIQDLASGNQGALAVGAMNGAASSLVALAVCKLLNHRPGINTKIIEDMSIKPLLAQLHNRNVDMLVCQQPHEFELKGTRTISLFRATRVACVRAEHPLTGNITLQDLATYPFVCPEEEVGLLFGFQQIFSTAGLDLPKILISNSIHVAKELVLNSDAFALFSDLSVLHERKLGMLRLAELPVPTQYWMHLIVRAEQTSTDLIEGFVGQIASVCRDLGIEAHADALRYRKSPRHASLPTER